MKTKSIVCQDGLSFLRLCHSAIHLMSSAALTTQEVRGEPQCDKKKVSPKLLVVASVHIVLVWFYLERNTAGSPSPKAQSDATEVTQAFCLN